MAWVTIMCPDGPYQLNPEGVTRIIRSYAYAKALIGNSRTEEQCHWLTSNLSIVNTDWSRVTKDRDATIRERGDDFYARLSRRMIGKAAIEYLETLVDDRDGYTESFSDMQRAATRKTMEAMDKYVSSVERNIEIAKFIRNTAAETELALVAIAATGGAGLVSGQSIARVGIKGAINLALAAPETIGIAESVASVSEGAAVISEGVSVGATRAAGLILGSVGKGAIKWQDTGSIGKGVYEGGVELVINTLTLGLKNTIKGATSEKLKKLVIGLVFGAVKGASKTLPNAYISPEEMAKGKRRTLAEMLLPTLVGIPSGAASEIVKSLSEDPRWVVPATVILKLGLKYGADAIAKPSDHSHSATFTGARTPLSSDVLTTLNKSRNGMIPRSGPAGSHSNGILAGRQSLVSCKSSCLSDCAQLSAQSTVLDVALHPIACF